MDTSLDNKDQLKPKAEATSAAHKITETIIDQHGDLWLHAKGTDSLGTDTSTRFLICSRTVARSSVVFDKMLFGGFAESFGGKNQNAGSKWEVELPDDAASAMRTLLLIMHNRTQDLARTASGSETFVKKLYDLMALADKYDCTTLFRPYASSWAQALLYPNPNEQSLLRLGWIFYQLGHKAKYEDVVTRLVMEVPQHDGDDSSEPPVLPPGLSGACISTHGISIHTRGPSH